MVSPAPGYITKEIPNNSDLLPLHIGNPQRYPFLLESVVQSVGRSRYDILFAFPSDRITLDSNHQLFFNEQRCRDSNFLAEFDRAWQSNQWRTEGCDQNLPFCGGWFVYLGYELNAQIEPKIKVILSESPLPVALAVRCPAAIIRDHVRNMTTLVAESDQTVLLELMEADYSRMVSDSNKEGANTVSEPLPSSYCVSEAPGCEYLNGVEKIKNYIHAGDVFQVNLSRQWCLEDASALSAVQLYQSLKLENPAPFAGLIVDRDWSIICSSPERLVSVVDGVIEARPIAGTRPRYSSDQQRDNHLSEELLANAKEQSEHIMLIDLERNDLGRVAEIGSVEVDELMVLESFAHVHHIVSNVRGKLKPNSTPGDVIRAVFPGGTITGCPKVRCMEIISELENTPRGPYTGSMGYVNHNGNLDLNILIRTMVKEGDTVHFRTGAGIVADSVGESELQETRDKARGLLLALGQNPK